MTDDFAAAAPQPELPPAQWPHQPPPAPRIADLPFGDPVAPTPVPPPPMQVGPPPRPVHLPPMEWASATRVAPRRRPERPEPSAEVLFGACLTYVAGIALVVAAFLPWVVSGSIEIDGWHATNDSHVLLGIGVGVLLVGTAIVGGLTGRAINFLLFGGAVAVAALSVADLVDAGRVSAGLLTSARPGVGPWLALSSSVVLLAAIWLVRQGTQEPSALRLHPDPA